MKLFEGKSPTERNKIIAALVLGVVCVIVFYFAFGRSLLGSGSTTTVTVKASPTPRTAVVPTNPRDFELPSQRDQELQAVIPIDYRPGSFWVPDPGRNIFAFYEPPPPCRDCPTPLPPPIITPTPTPTPEPDFKIAFLTPGSVYAGSKSFRLEINGDRFTPDARIYFSQREIPTTFINEQKLVADIPASLITGGGLQQIIVQTADGKMYSNQVSLDVQPPPKPSFQYIGMIARKRSNNDTAYFMEAGKPTPMGARLNDVVTGRFRLVSISEEETIFEDVSLGFRHKLPLFRPPPGTASSSGPPRSSGFPGGDSYIPFNPVITNTNTSPQSIPGIPDNIPRYVPPNPRPPRPPANSKQDVDDDEDGDN